MNRTRAIALCLMSIESRCDLSASDRLVIMDHLEMMYQAGYESLIYERKEHLRQPVLQLHNGKIINRFESIQEAARILSIDLNYLEKSLRSKKNNVKTFNLIKESDYGNL
jgi:hypothetical protein